METIYIKPTVRGLGNTYSFRTSMHDKSMLMKLRNDWIKILKSNDDFNIVIEEGWHDKNGK